MGEADLGTHKTEQLVMLNGMASRCGHSGESLPHPNLSVPSRIHEAFPEDIGFTHCLRCEPQDTATNPANPINTGENCNAEDITVEVEADRETDEEDDEVHCLLFWMD